MLSADNDRLAPLQLMAHLHHADRALSLAKILHLGS